jgi:hypothetical protein
LVNSRLDQFTAAPSGSLRTEFTLPGRPLSRSYGAILPSSLTRVISLTSVCSTCPPVSVIGTGTRILPRGFSWRHGIGDLPAVKPAGIAPRVKTPSRISLRRLATCLPQDNHRLGSLTLPRHPIGHNGTTWYRNINLLAIGYAFRPRLRSRLTLSRRTLLRKPWTNGGGDSHPSFVTHAGILTSQASTEAYASASGGLGTLSYRAQSPQACAPIASETSFSPVELSAPEHLTSELLRTLSRVAASKPTSWLSRHSDIVSHLAST